MFRGPQNENKIVLHVHVLVLSSQKLFISHWNLITINTVKKDKKIYF